MTKPCPLQTPPPRGACATLAAPAALAQKKPRNAPRLRPNRSRPEARNWEARRAEGRRRAGTSLSILVRWQGKPCVTRYRLQLANRRKVSRTLSSPAVEGKAYVVTGLAKGNYFWRVAPAVGETSPFYSTPERVTVIESASGRDARRSPHADESAVGGGRASRARRPGRVCRQGRFVDFIGVARTAEFRAYGANGVSLWTMRLRAGRRARPRVGLRALARERRAGDRPT